MIAVLKREWVGFFKNPIGYVIMGVYAFLSALLFCLFVVLPSTSYVGYYFGTWLTLVNAVIVSVMAMRFFTEEKKNRTDQLIMTCPVGMSGVVMGKFLGGMTVFTACTLLNLVYVFVIDVFGSPDSGTVWSNFIGTWLLGAAMIAVALFVSSLTESPFAASAGTFAVFVFFFVVDFVAAMLSRVVPDWLYGFLKKLNIFAWYDDFAGGILSLKSVVFYLSIAAVFLFLTVRILERRRWH